MFTIFYAFSNFGSVMLAWQAVKAANMVSEGGGGGPNMHYGCVIVCWGDVETSVAPGFWIQITTEYKSIWLFY